MRERNGYIAYGTTHQEAAVACDIVHARDLLLFFDKACARAGSHRGTPGCRRRGARGSSLAEAGGVMMRPESRKGYVEARLRRTMSRGSMTAAKERPTMNA